MGEKIIFLKNWIILLKNFVLGLAIQATVAQVAFCSNGDPKFHSGVKFLLAALGILIPKTHTIILKMIRWCSVHFCHCAYSYFFGMCLSVCVVRSVSAGEMRTQTSSSQLQMFPFQTCMLWLDPQLGGIWGESVLSLCPKTKAFIELQRHEIHISHKLKQAQAILRIHKWLEMATNNT